MNAARHVVVFDPTSAAQAEIARLLVRECPPRHRIAAMALRAESAVPADGFDAECVILLAASRANALREHAVRTQTRVRLVVAFLDAWPADLLRFHACYAIADLVLISDERLWRRLGFLPRTCCLPLALDEDTFHIQDPAKERGAGILGLRPPLSEPQPAYEPWLHGLAAFLEGTEFTEIVQDQNVTPERRADGFNRAATVLCASASDASRERLIEAAACGCSVVVTRRANRDGIVRDGINGTVVDADSESIVRGLRTSAEDRARMVSNMQAWIRSRGWRSRGSDVFEAIFAAGTDGVPSDWQDLTAEVTVFVATVGAASLPACLAHLAEQRCRFRLQKIEHVAPMSAAFQAMLDRCETPYYVQVDEDMLLYPDAIGRLHAALQGAPDDIAFVVAYLYDVHLQQPVQGVKIFRHRIVRRYPFADVQSCELDQVDRLRADGFAYRVLPAVPADGADDSDFPYAILGLHGATHSPRSVYERFRTLEMARRKSPRRFNHQEHWPKMLVERFLERRDPLDFYALMGLLAGAIAPAEASGEKDFRTYSSLPGFEGAVALMRGATGDDNAA
jgi:hypothetical protein